MTVIQIILLLTGALAVAAPYSCTRKDDRSNPDALKRTRTIGMWLFFAGLICLISDKVF